MKIKSLVLGMMACAAFTACTNDEIVDNNGGGNKIEGDAYVAVNIVSSSSANSRALGSIETGSDNENKVTSAIFFFFDVNGNGCATPSKPTLDFTDEAGKPSVISKAVLVLENAKSIPASIVAVMNPSTEIAGLGADTSLAALRATVAKATAVGSFIMSNSAYAVNKTLVDATPISAENICVNSEDALKKPVNIPVERVVAKIATVFATDINMSDEKFLIDGVMTKIKVQLLGWKATELNPESNLIKAIDPTWTMAWWNDAANSRSFWGNSRATSTYLHFDHTAIAGNKGAEYCLENTTGTTTKMIVAAQLQTEAGAAIDLMEWKGAKNTKENMKTILANTNDIKKYYTKDGDKYTSLAAKYIDFTTVGTSDKTRYTVIATLATGTPEIYTIANEVATPVTVADVNATLKALGEIKHWNGGASYFYTSIEHNGGEGMGQYGIIRNHSYKLNVNAVSGLGTPVPDPDEEIIPEKPTTDDASFIAATVQVLAWKIVTQEVNLSDK